MSVKVKRRFEEMQVYLGRDTEGLKKLKLLKDDVNELRTGLAAAKEQLEQAVAIKDAARERADAAEAELVRVRMEHDRLNQVVQGLSQRAAAAEKAIKSLQADDDDDIVLVAAGADSEAEIKAAVKAMRRRMKYCPPPVSSHTYEREAFAAGWTHSDIWLLGAAVATLAAMRGYVTITTDKTLADLPTTYDNEMYSVKRQVAEWMTKYNVEKETTPSAAMRLCAAAMPAESEASQKTYHRLY